MGVEGGADISPPLVAEISTPRREWTQPHTETMGQITYKAFGKKMQNPGAVITAQTFL